MVVAIRYQRAAPCGFRRFKWFGPSRAIDQASLPKDHSARPPLLVLQFQTRLHNAATDCQYPVPGGWETYSHPKSRWPCIYRYTPEPSGVERAVQCHTPSGHVQSHSERIGGHSGGHRRTVRLGHWKAHGGHMRTQNRRARGPRNGHTGAHERVAGSWVAVPALSQVQDTKKRHTGWWGAYALNACQVMSRRGKTMFFIALPISQDLQGQKGGRV